MGLDISYYSNAELEANPKVDSDGWPETDGVVRIYANQSFPDRETPLKDGACYRVGEGGSFLAGSYGGYNQWREQLAVMAGYPLLNEKYRDSPTAFAGAAAAGAGPFWELIYFSDCEGVIGTESSKKLAADFAKYQNFADAHDDEYFREKYSNWRAAFETAANSGFVDFH